MLTGLEDEAPCGLEQPLRTSREMTRRAQASVVKVGGGLWQETTAVITQASHSITRSKKSRSEMASTRCLNKGTI